MICIHNALDTVFLYIFRYIQWHSTTGWLSLVSLPFHLSLMLAKRHIDFLRVGEDRGNYAKYCR